jgi:hypothetical protein
MDEVALEHEHREVAPTRWQRTVESRVVGRVELLDAPSDVITRPLFIYRNVPEVGTGIDPGGRLTSAPAEGALPSAIATETNASPSARDRIRLWIFIKPP